MKTIVLGMGNILLGDEGVGVHAARALMQEANDAETQILEVGTAILDALPVLGCAARIIIIDAMQAQGRPGSVYRSGLKDCSGSACIASMHGFDIFRVLALSDRNEIPETVVFGVEPDHIGWSLELSAPVAKALPALLEAVRNEIGLPQLAAND
jgi:hydrogenase maturation protease